MKKVKYILLVLIVMFLVGCNKTANNKDAYVTIKCDKDTISVNEEVNCTIKGYLNDKISSVSGKLENSSNIELFNIKGSDNWEGDKTSTNIQYYSVLQEKGEFDIATFKIKGLKKGKSEIKFTKFKNANEVVRPNIGNSEFKSIYINDSVTTVSVK